MTTWSKAESNLASYPEHDSGSSSRRSVTLARRVLAALKIAKSASGNRVGFIDTAILAIVVTRKKSRKNLDGRVARD